MEICSGYRFRFWTPLDGRAYNQGHPPETDPMATKEPDKVQREIEELLDRLDNFVPEERFVEKIKKRRRETDGPTSFERAKSGIARRLSSITLGHVMLLGVLLLLSAWLAPGLFGGYARW